VGFSNEERTYDNAREDILKEMERTFSPEFRNRLDFTVFFNQLSRDDVKRIIINEVENNVPIVLNDDIINYITDNGFSAKYGARQLQRFIKTHVSLKVADAQLDELVPVSGTFYEAEIRDNELFIINTENYHEQRVEKPTENRSSKAGRRKSPSSKAGSRKASTRKRKPSTKEEGPKEEE
jgi:ATP-dependent Clp protease ATP-binding subunit ClpA